MFLYRLLLKHKEILAIFFLTIIFFHKIILHPNKMIYPGGDIVAQYSFEKKFMADYVLQYKQLPLWNPYVYGGVSFLANPAAAIFYPANIFFLLYSTDMVFGYLFMINVFLLGLFTYLYAKTIHLDSFSSLIASVIMMFNGSIIGKTQLGHLYILDTIIWLPLLLFFYEKHLQTKKTIYIVLSSFPIALMLLAGSMQIAEYNISAALIYIILRYVLTEKNKKINQVVKFCFLTSLSLIFGLGLVSIQLFPLAEFSQISTRKELSFVFASDFSLHPYQLLSFILPHFFGSSDSYWGINGSFWELNGYVGILPLFLSLISFLHKKKLFVTIFSFLAILSILFSFGRFSFLFGFLYNYVPTFNFFRVPARAIYLYIFSVSILAGIGTNILIQSKTKNQYNQIFLKIRHILGLIIVPTLLSTVIFYTNKNFIIDIIQKKGYAINRDLSEIYLFILRDLILFNIFLISIFILLLIGATKKINILYVKLVILTIIVVDLWIFGMHFINVTSPREIFYQQQIIQYIQGDKSRYRTLDLTGEFISTAPRNHIEMASGYGSLFTKDYRDFIWASGDHAVTPFEGFFTLYNIKKINILQLLNIKYIISDKDVSRNNPGLAYTETHMVYKIKQTLPRAYVVPNAIVIEDKSKTLKALINSSFNPKDTVILRQNPMHPTSNPSSFTEAKIVSFRPNEIKLKTSLSQPGFLVLSEIWYPGWKAIDNGHLKTIYRANYIFRSIYLEKGNHNISFIYEPDTFKIGKYISAGSALIIVLVFLIYFKKRKIN